MRLFGSDRIAKMMDRLGLEEGEVIQHSMITKSIERAQKKVEENNFGMRKRLLEYDDVMNSQREVIYRRRKNALYGERVPVDLGGPVEAGRVMASVISIRVGAREIEVPAWVQPGHPDNSITVTTGYGRTLGTDRVISDRSLLARLFDKDVDIYRPGPLANGIGA